MLRPSVALVALAALSVALAAPMAPHAKPRPWPAAVTVSGVLVENTTAIIGPSSHISLSKGRQEYSTQCSQAAPAAGNSRMVSSTLLAGTTWINLTTWALCPTKSQYTIESIGITTCQYRPMGILTPSDCSECSDPLSVAIKKCKSWVSAADSVNGVIATKWSGVGCVFGFPIPFITQKYSFEIWYPTAPVGGVDILKWAAGSEIIESVGGMKSHTITLETVTVDSYSEAAPPATTFSGHCKP